VQSSGVEGMHPQVTSLVKRAEDTHLLCNAPQGPYGAWREGMHTPAVQRRRMGVHYKAPPRFIFASRFTCIEEERRGEVVWSPSTPPLPPQRFTNRRFHGKHLFNYSV
jgi:hypothetical protein